MQDGKKDDLNSLVGRSLGQFRVVERIGTGGMAAVFKAYQPNLDRYVAIKVLPVYHARDPIFVKRFEQEARAVARLAHPNIVQIHDFGTQDSVTYIVMEYVDGGTLKDRLRKPLAVSESIDFIIQAAHGLDCAHRNVIIHRDVKPAIMLLRKDGHLLLSDFGIAKILEGTTNLTRVGTGIGTPQYMSPEQGTGQRVDRPSDIYSLGIVLFHCLTGRVPFTADNPLSITVKHLNEPLPMELLHSVNVPTIVEQIVYRMTAKAPQARYQSAEELIEALTNALAVSQLSIPRPWRPGMASVVSPIEQKNVGDFQSLVGDKQLEDPRKQLSNGIRASSPSLPDVSVVCFRCGAISPSDRPICISCGYDLSDKYASSDQYLGPNGRPILARLTLQSGPQVGRAYRFHQVVTTIGRTNGNDLIISGLTVSRNHARLWFDKGNWYLEDKGSANGTLVNSMRIMGAVKLNDGDVINFGHEVVLFNVNYR